MTFWLDRPVFVTGATGLVGSHLVAALLERGAAVTALVRDWSPRSELVRTGNINRCHVVRGCIEDRNLIERILAEYEVDTVYSLAAQTVVSIGNKSPYQTFLNNCVGAASVLEAVRNYGKVRSCIVSSSDKSYGELPEHRAYVEADPVNGLHPYDATKSITDLWAQVYGLCYGLPVGISRCGNIYGGGDLNWNRLIPGSIRRIIRGGKPVIWGSGDEVRDFLFIDDCISAYLTMGECAAVGPYNFSGGREVTVREAVETINRVMGKPAKRYQVNRHLEGEIIYQSLDISKAERELGWKPQFNLTEGLERTAAWYREYLTGE